jgi:FkbM family methyltransferase
MRASEVTEEIYDQGAELDLLAALVPHLRERSLVDVGPEHGALAAALREAGFGPVWALEPFPGSIDRLRARFGSDPDVHLLEVAAAEHDGTSELHLAVDPEGATKDAFHSLHPTPPSADLRWDGSVPVTTRSLASLAEAGEIPRHIGLLKIDAEGSDAEILRGASGLEAELVMVEFWGYIPGSSGECPYTLDELRGLVAPLGLSRFLFVRHGPRHVSIGRWDEADAATGEWGNLVFMADSLVSAADAALPAIDRALLDRNESVTAGHETAAAAWAERAELLDRTAAERLELIEKLHGTLAGRRHPVRRLGSRLRRGLRPGGAR